MTVRRACTGSRLAAIGAKVELIQFDSAVRKRDWGGSFRVRVYGAACVRAGSRLAAIGAKVELIQFDLLERKRNSDGSFYVRVLARRFEDCGIGVKVELIRNDPSARKRNSDGSFHVSERRCGGSRIAVIGI